MSMSSKELLTSALPAITELCEGRKARLIAAALAALREGTLTEARALHFWMEVNANEGLLKSVETKVKTNATVEIVNG